MACTSWWNKQHVRHDVLCNLQGRNGARRCTTGKFVRRRSTLPSVRVVILVISQRDKRVCNLMCWLSYLSSEAEQKFCKLQVEISKFSGSSNIFCATTDSDNVVVEASQAGHRLRFGTCSSYILLLTCSVLGLKSFFFSLLEKVHDILRVRLRKSTFHLLHSERFAWSPWSGRMHTWVQDDKTHQHGWSMIPRACKHEQSQ